MALTKVGAGAFIGSIIKLYLQDSTAGCITTVIVTSNVCQTSQFSQSTIYVLIK